MPTSKSRVQIGLSESQVNDLIHEYGTWELEESFTSLVQQDAVEDALTNLDFGATKTSPNGIISYNNTTKVLESLKSGPLLAKTRVRLARVGGSAGTSEVFLQAQSSTDGGSNWVNTGNSADISLKDSEQVEIFFDFAAVYFSTGLLIRQVFARSSTGTDFGSAIAGIPSAPLQALGISSSPAAQVSIYRLRDFNYV